MSKTKSDLEWTIYRGKEMPGACPSSMHSTQSALTMLTPLRSHHSRRPGYV